MSSPLKTSQLMADNKEVHREINRYLRCMTLKCAQYVVNSRCPLQKSCQKAFSRSSSELWFNLSIADNSTLLEEIRHLYGGRQLELSQPFCIHVHLRTAEDESMLVEKWWFKKQILSPPSTNTSKSVLYTNLTTLLKSLVVMTTSLPGNSLSRKQMPSSYMLHYSLKVGEPMVDPCGDLKEHCLGGVSFGAVQFSVHVAWRTKFEFAPRRRRRSEMAAEMSEDHFESSHATTMPQPTPPRLRADSFHSPTLSKAAFQLTPPDDDSDEEVPFGMLLKLASTPPCTPPSFHPHLRHRNRHLSDADNGVILEDSDHEEDGQGAGSSARTTGMQQYLGAAGDPGSEQADPMRMTFASHFNDIKQLSVFSEDIPDLEMFKDEEEGEGGIEGLVRQFRELEAAKEEIFEFVGMIDDVDDDYSFY